MLKLKTLKNKTDFNKKKAWHSFCVVVEGFFKTSYQELVKTLSKSFQNKSCRRP